MDKNQSVEIKFVGKTRTIFNVVSYEQFKKLYEPKGWVLKDNSIVLEEKDFKVVDNSPFEEVKVEAKPVEKIVEELKTTNETEIKNIASMKKNSTEKKFNDKIIKE